MQRSYDPRARVYAGLAITLAIITIVFHAAMKMGGLV
jgi:hypothetical protein